MRFSVNCIILLLLIACQSSTSESTKHSKPRIEKKPGVFQQKIIAYKGIDYLTAIVDLRSTKLATFHRNKQGELYKSFEAIKKAVEDNNQELLFAMNGGIFNTDRTSTGLYIENTKQIVPLNIKKGKGNFYLKPSGVLTITEAQVASITNTSKYKKVPATKTAIQSGPQLLTDGKIHPKFNESSKNTHLRNGVGLIDEHTLVFAMSTEKVNLFNFASFFADNFQCLDALYLDGFVSKVYSPALQQTKLEGDFSVIIGVLK